jgi:PAS domain S-box-containing protein
LLWQPPEVFTPERQPDGSLSSERARENNAAAIEKGVNYFEWVIRTLDGRELWVEVDQTVIPIRGRQVFYTILRDIEERKRSEEALKESEERYRRVVELSPCGIVIHVAGKIEFANRSFADMVAAPRPEQLYGKNALDFCHPDFTELAAARITMIEAGEPQVPLVEQKLVRLDGSVIDVELTAFHFSLKGRNAVMVATKDITERKRAEENLLTRESELETRSFELAETNTALNVLLRRREEDKVALENAIQANVKEVVFPYIEKLRSTHLSGTQGSYVNIIESSLNEIISPFLHKMAARYAGLTRSEIQVANMIKGGKSSKEIANALNVSIGTVETHRNSIRKKLGLRHKNGNLQAHLLSL